MTVEKQINLLEVAEKEQTGQEDAFHPEIVPANTISAETVKPSSKPSETAPTDTNGMSQTQKELFDANTIGKTDKEKQRLAEIMAEYGILRFLKEIENNGS